VVVIPGIQGRWEWMTPAIDALAATTRVLSVSLAGEPRSGARFDPSRGLDAFLDQIDALQPLVDQFTQTNGAPPADWTPLVRAGRLPGVPLDPSRAAPYEIDASGRVGVSRRSPLFPLPVEPQRMFTPPFA